MKPYILVILVVSAIAESDPIVVDRKIQDIPPHPDRKVDLIQTVNPEDEVTHGFNPRFLHEQKIQSRALFSPEECSNSHPTKPKCHNCTHMEYCMNGRVVTISCKKQTGKDYCSMSKDECTDETESCYDYWKFCPTNNAVYPDLSKCDRYVYCFNTTVDAYQCNYRTVYDWRKRSCSDQADCVTFTEKTGCSGDNIGKLVEHPNSRWYVYCGWDPLLNICPGFNYTFDPDLGTCRFQCGVDVWDDYNWAPPTPSGIEWISGRKYPDDFDNAVYYTCTKVGNRWDTKEERCPRGMEFVEYMQICIYKEQTTLTTTEITSSFSSTEESEATSEGFPGENTTGG